MAIPTGVPAPDFTLECHTEQTIRLSDYQGRCNVVLAFFPLAWTPIWTGQIPSYQSILDRFEGIHAQVLGISVDSVPCLKAWAESLGGITYPLLSDFYPHGAVAEEYGVLRHEGYAERAIFVIDSEGIVRYVDVHDIDEQPDNDVLLDVLDKLDPWPDRRPPVPVKAVEPAAPAPVVQAGVPAVTMYCTPWCPACRRARAFFKERGIPITEVDISRDREAARRVRDWAKGFETTPTFEVNRQVVVDFKQEQVALLEKLLAE